MGLFRVNVASTLLVKNPNWWEAADQLAIYKRGRGDETRDCLTLSVHVIGLLISACVWWHPGWRAVHSKRGGGVGDSWETPVKVC